jgi:hypothetical protein
MAQKKPTSVVVIAILQLLFGTLGLILAAVNLSGLQKQLSTLTKQNQQQSISPERLEEMTQQKVPSFAVVQNVQLGLSALLCAMMIASGIGLLGLRRWARSLGIVYAVVSILSTAGAAAYSFALLAPAYQEIGDEIIRQGGANAQINGMAIKVSGYIGPGCGLLTVIYPVIVLIVLNLSSVRAAFRGEPLPGEMEEGDYAAEDIGEPGDDHGVVG